MLAHLSLFHRTAQPNPLPARDLIPGRTPGTLSNSIGLNWRDGRSLHLLCEDALHFVVPHVADGLPSAVGLLFPDAEKFSGGMGGLAAVIPRNPGHLRC